MLRFLLPLLFVAVVFAQKEPTTEPDDTAMPTSGTDVNPLVSDSTPIIAPLETTSSENITTTNVTTPNVTMPNVTTMSTPMSTEPSGNTTMTTAAPSSAVSVGPLSGAILCIFFVMLVS